MLTYDPFKIAQAILELWNNGNPTPVKELRAPAATVRYIFEKEEKPAVRAQDEYEMLHTGFPDLKMVLTDIIPAEGTLTIEYKATGTHLGPFMEIPPTGRVGELRGTTVLKINEDGKIVKETAYIDLINLLEQIGAVPPAVEPAKLRQTALDLVETLNHREIEKLMAHVVPHPVVTFDGTPIRDFEVRELLLRTLVALPDLKLQVNHVAVRGNEVVLEVVGTATHEAQLFELPVTHRPLKLEAALILTFREKLVEKIRIYTDLWQIRTQLGMTPELAKK